MSKLLIKHMFSFCDRSGWRSLGIIRSSRDACVTHTITSIILQFHSLLKESLYPHYRNHDPLRHSNDPGKLCYFLKAKSASYILETYEASTAT